MKLKKKKEKIKKGSQNGVVLAPLTATPNRALTEYYIDKKCKLEDWNDKTES